MFWMVEMEGKKENKPHFPCSIYIECCIIDIEKLIYGFITEIQKKEFFLTMKRYKSFFVFLTCSV